MVHDHRSLRQGRRVASIRRHLGKPYGTYHHNLIAHNDSRNPRWASGCGYNDYRNNVLYNWGYESCYGGEAHQKGDRRNPPIQFSTINMVANYYKAGPATRSDVRDRIANPSSRRRRRSRQLACGGQLCRWFSRSDH